MFNAPIDQYTMAMGKRGAAKINSTTLLKWKKLRQE